VAKVDVQAVILDMDGLMIDTESIYKRAWQKAAADLGFPLDDAFYFTLIGQPNPACEAIIMKHYGNEFPLPAFRHRWPELWQIDVEAHGIPAKPGLHELLTFLDENGIPYAVATSSDQEYTSLSLRAAGLDGKFRQIITGDQIRRGKPAPDIYLESARRLGVLPEHCVAVEDSDAGIIAARSAGIIPVMVPDLKSPSPEARAAAFVVVPSLLEAITQIAALRTAGGLE
jgi:beta-phosphoglucomutase